MITPILHYSSWMGCTLLEAPSMASRVGCTRFLPEEEGAGGAEALSRVAGVDDAS